RFHGHSDRWDSHDIHERFGYRYSEEELRTWARRLPRLAAQAEVTQVFMNNCYRDYAQRNAATLMDLLASYEGEASARRRPGPSRRAGRTPGPGPVPPARPAETFDPVRKIAPRRA
ncbi:MAG TPA: DUF72 domain-containing protein, partial [Frankiaceae bacterium]|nr:DUF72 domain-containing protein [Frankiaceae bacterium]